MVSAVKRAWPPTALSSRGPWLMYSRSLTDCPRTYCRPLLKRSQTCSSRIAFMSILGSVKNITQKLAMRAPSVRRTLITLAQRSVKISLSPRSAAFRWFQIIQYSGGSMKSPTTRFMCNCSTAPTATPSPTCLMTWPMRSPRSFNRTWLLPSARTARPSKLHQ